MTTQPTTNQQLGDAAALGIKYDSTFNLAQAVVSYNATRKAIRGKDGVERPAEDFHFKPSTEWLQRYAGEFTVRRASIMEQITMSAEVDRLLAPCATADGDSTASARTEALADAFATCRYLVTKAPDWFDLNTLSDTNVAFLIHHWHAQWQSQFRG